MKRRFWTVIRAAATAIAAAAERRIGNDADPWEARVLAFIGERAEVKLSEVVSDCLGIPVTRQTQADRNRAALILVRAGWRRMRRRLPYSNQCVVVYAPVAERNAA